MASVNMPDWPSLAICFTILKVWKITWCVCLLERLTDIIRILGEHLKSNGTSLQGIAWTKWVSKCKGARSAHHILFLSFSVWGVALYDETKMMLYHLKSHEIGHTNHRHIKLIILQVWNVYHKNCSSYLRISKGCVTLCTEYIFHLGLLGNDIFMWMST